MGLASVSVSEEENFFQKQIGDIEAWWQTPRHASLKRPYSARRIAVLRGSRLVDYPANAQALKLWALFRHHQSNGTFELTYGVSDTIMAAEMVKHQDTVYVSGSLCSLSSADHPGVDQADYPWDTVPKVVSRIHKALTWNDQRQRQYRLSQPLEVRGGLPSVDYLAPIIADADMGFGSPSTAMKVAAAFVEAGAAMFHIDDLAIGMKKFTTGQGRTIVPTSEYELRLAAARTQLDIMGAETLILTRSDCIKAQFITSTIDPRDHEYILGATRQVESFAQTQTRDIESGISNTTMTRRRWVPTAGLMTFDEAVEAQCSSDEQRASYLGKVSTGMALPQRRAIAREVIGKDVWFDWDLPRSISGQYMYKWSAKAAAERQIAAARYGDMSWPRMDFPDEALTAEIYRRVTDVYPERMFCFGFTNSYDWAGNGFGADRIREFPALMAKYGAVFQIQPVWPVQGLRAYTNQCCKMLKDKGIAGYYEEIQKPALDLMEGESGMASKGGYLADGFMDTLLARDF